MNIGEKVCFTTCGADDIMTVRTGVVTSTWYEPGDPVMGVSVMGDDGQGYGSLDSQEVCPISMLETLRANVEKANAEWAAYKNASR